MSVHEAQVPLFDLLYGDSQPYGGFGAILREDSKYVEEFRSRAQKSLKDLQAGLGINQTNWFGAASSLDAIVEMMWQQGWNPESGNTNLFSTDFGFVIAMALHSVLGGVFVFRSYEDISHTSIMWTQKRVEAFPFHKAYKCLLDRGAESVGQFLSSVGSLTS